MKTFLLWLNKVPLAKTLTYTFSSCIIILVKWSAQAIMLWSAPWESLRAPGILELRNQYLNSSALEKDK